MFFMEMIIEVMSMIVWWMMMANNLLIEMAKIIFLFILSGSVW